MARLLGIPQELQLEIEENSPGMTTRAAELIAEYAIQQAKEATTAQTARAIKEVQAIVGPHGALARVQSGGLRITPGLGMGMFVDGTFKTNIQPNGTLMIGSDINRPATTTEVFFVEDTTYNNEAFGAGDFLIGDNTVGNLKWDASDGQLQFRNGTTITAYMGTDGKLNFVSGTIGGWEITTDAIRKITGGAGIILDSANDYILVGSVSGTRVIIDGGVTTGVPGIYSSNFVAGQSGFLINANTGDAEFNNIVARGELKTFLFTASNQMAVAGNIIVSKDAGKLGAAVSTSDTTVNFGKALTVGNWIKIQGPDTAGTASLEWMLIGSLVSGTTYNVTRNVDGSGANAWAKDTPFVVIGANGDSRIELVAGSSAGVSLITQGAAWNTTTTQASMSTVDGAIIAGAGNVKIDAGGITFSSNGQYFSFKDTGGSATKYILRTADDALSIDNIQTGKAIRFHVKQTDATQRYLELLEDAANANVAQFNLDPTGGAKISIGGAVVIWADKTGKETVFNDDSFDIDFRIEGDTDANLFKLDAGLDKIGIGTAGAPGYKLDVNGDVNVATGSTYKVNGTTVISGTVTGVTNGDSHDHNGGDGAAITDANLSTSDITTNDASTSKHGFLKKLDNTATHFMNGQGSWLAVTVPVPIIMHGNDGTVGASPAVAYATPGLSGIQATTEYTMVVPFAGTMKNLSIRTTGTQPASGSLVGTLRKGGVDQTLTVTIAAGSGAGTYTDSTHSVALVAGDLIDVRFVNNASATSCNLRSITMEFDVANV